MKTVRSHSEHESAEIPFGASIPGDFDFDGELSASDIDALSLTARAGENSSLFDVNDDAKVGPDDRRIWVTQLKHTWFGDANLDGQFDTGDLVTVFQAGQYEDSLTGNSTWATGDFNGDTEFDTGDMVFAFQEGGYEKGPRAAAAVPEPTSCLLLVAGVLSLARRCGRNRRASSIRRLYVEPLGVAAIHSRTLSS
jgi:hypothetical protein